MFHNRVGKHYMLNRPYVLLLAIKKLLSPGETTAACLVINMNIWLVLSGFSVDQTFRAIAGRHIHFNIIIIRENFFYESVRILGEADHFPFSVKLDRNFYRHSGQVLIDIKAFSG